MLRLDDGRRMSRGTVRLSVVQLDRAMARRGLSQEALAIKADVSRNTVQKACSGRAVYRDTAIRIARALNTAIEHLMENSEQPASGPGETCGIGGEWRIAETLGPWITASNALQYRVCRLEHKYVSGRQARGKRFDLEHLSVAGRESIREQLLRHPTVCERIRRSPHVAENLSVHPEHGENEWWVIDRWTGGTSLSARLANGPLELADLMELMIQIARGLEVLHEAEIVVRELAPERVLITEEGRQAVLTDFELAKLLDGSPTVSADWPADEYRAPEIEGGVTTVQADIYSWGRVLAHAACGRPPARGDEARVLAATGLPKKVWATARDCLSLRPSGRPKTIGDVLHVLASCNHAPT